MPVLSERPSVPSLYILLGCALVLLCIILRHNTSANARSVNSITMSSPSSSDEEKEDLVRGPRAFKSHQPSPGPRIPAQPQPPPYHYGAPATSTPAGPSIGVNPNFQEPSFSKMPQPIPKSQSSTASSHAFSPSTTRTFSSSSNFTAQTPITPFSAQKHTFTDSPTSYAKFPPFPAPTSRSYDSATMPAHAEIPNTNPPYISGTRDFQQHYTAAAAGHQKPYHGGTAQEEYYRSDSDLDSSSSPTSSFSPHASISVELPRRRSYTKTATSAGGGGGPELLEGQIEIGEGWRRHTRVFGGGVCVACEESARRMGSWVKGGGAAAVLLQQVEGGEGGDEREGRRRSA